MKIYLKDSPSEITESVFSLDNLESRYKILASLSHLLRKYQQKDLTKDERERGKMYFFLFLSHLSSEIN